MPNHITVTVSPGDQQPRLVMRGAPVIEWRDRFSGVAVNLGGHPDPAAYLRELALGLVNLANRIDASAEVSA